MEPATVRKSSALRKAAPAKPARTTRANARRGHGAVKRGKPAKFTRSAEPVIRLVKVKELDPIAKCGPATSVEQLFRVDEDTNGQATVHLVFFDRHGWYCVHGARCAAVTDVHAHTRARARGR